MEKSVLLEKKLIVVATKNNNKTILTLYYYLGTICYRVMIKVTRRGTPPWVYAFVWPFLVAFKFGGEL